MQPMIANIKEGDSVSVNCYASGIPTPTYLWKFLRDIPGEFLPKVLALTIPKAEDSFNTKCECLNLF